MVVDLVGGGLDVDQAPAEFVVRPGVSAVGGGVEQQALEGAGAHRLAGE